MKHLFSTLSLGAVAVSAAVFPPQQALGQVSREDVLIENEQFLLELAPGEMKWVTEDEKWELKRVNT